MTTLRVHMFGKFSARRNGQTLDGLYACKVQELFCYILVHRNSAHSREALASLLWGDCTTAQSKKYLRQALWQLQVILNDPQASSAAHRVLLVEPDWLQLNPQADLWLDVDVFEQAFSLIQGLAGRELGNQEEQVIRQAVQLYNGCLLDGLYQDWCLYERERFQNMYLSMLDKLMDYCEKSSQYEAGLAYGTRVLHHDRARERTHRQMMRLYYLAGDRTAAIRQYRRCVEMLEEELGVKPERRTSIVYEQIRADQIETLMQLHNPARGGDTVTAALVKIFDLVNQLQALLAELQQQARPTF